MKIHTIFLVSFLVIIILARSAFAAHTTTIFDVTYNKVFNPIAFDFQVTPMGCMIKSRFGFSYPGNLYSWWVPETFVSVFDAPINSHFKMWPIALSQILKEGAIANLVYHRFGKHNVSPSWTVKSRQPVDGGGDFFLNAHVGPVFFAQEAYAKMAFLFGPLTFPLHGLDGKCIHYSTGMDAEQWRFGTLDRHFANMTFNLLAASGGLTLLSAGQKTKVGQFICNTVKTLGGNGDCSSNLLDSATSLLPIALSSPITGCAALGLSFLPPIGIPRYALADPAFFAQKKLIFAREFLYGPACDVNVNTYPIIDSNTYCYDNRFIFPRTGHVRAQTWPEAAYITAIKSLQLATVTSAQFPFTPLAKICTEEGDTCFPYGTPSKIVSMRFRDFEAFGSTNRIGYVVWTLRGGCRSSYYPRAMVNTMMMTQKGAMRGLVLAEWQRQAVQAVTGN
jgi:hypothetical protein